MNSLRIARELFIEASGVSDSRNSRKQINTLLDNHFGEDNCIWYHNAFNLVVEMYHTGKYWMYPPEDFNRILLDHIDDWITVGHILFEYK